MDSAIIEKSIRGNDNDVISISEMIKNRLYFVTYKNTVPENVDNIHFFSALDDFTPDENSEPISRLSLGTISQYIKTLNIKLSSTKLSDKIIVSYSTGSERKRSNATVFIGVYAITHLSMSPEESAVKLAQHTSISPLDSLKAVQTASELGFVNFLAFNDEDFSSLDNVKLNWVIPGKLLLFSGPLESSSSRYLSPKRYLTYFYQVGVTCVIRLSHMRHDANPFVNANFSHYDLNIVGTVPQDKVLEVFLELCEQNEGVILIHCRDVLGRGGCLIGAYLVKHYGMSAGEAIAWVRMCTSECVMETQKTWLKNNELALQKAGKEARLKKTGDVNTLPHCGQGICSTQCNLLSTFKLKENQTDENTNIPKSAEDITALLENEVRVVQIEGAKNIGSE